jgi:predicted homoserine dehydrogenase-like protein
MDRYVTPDTVREDAVKLEINPHFLVTFRDTTKTAIEMASISNATGLVPDCRGMHGPVAGIEDMAKLFCLRKEGGLLTKLGVVEYTRPLTFADGSIDFFSKCYPRRFCRGTRDPSADPKRSGLLERDSAWRIFHILYTVPFSD